MTGILLIPLLLSLPPTAPVSAECSNQSNRWPRFSDVAATARLVVVGTVVETNRRDPTEDGPIFRVLVEEVLRGESDELIEIDAVRSGRPLRGERSCRRSAYLYATLGDRVALALRAREDRTQGRVNTMAVVAGVANRHQRLGIERLTLDAIRTSALGSEEEPGRGDAAAEVRFRAPGPFDELYEAFASRTGLRPDLFLSRLRMIAGGLPGD